jgi:hypothetical protein
MLQQTGTSMRNKRQLFPPNLKAYREGRREWLLQSKQIVYIKYITQSK